MNNEYDGLALQEENLSLSDVSEPTICFSNAWFDSCRLIP